MAFVVGSPKPNLGTFGSKPLAWAYLSCWSQRAVQDEVPAHAHGVVSGVVSGDVEGGGIR